MTRSQRLLQCLSIFLTVLASTVYAQDVDPIVIKGSKFFYKTNGTQFYIRGIAYQQDFQNASSSSSADGYTDPLADSAGCSRDIPYLTQLNTNTIRVYAIDPTKDHTSCMTMLANAGIYVLADLGSPDISIEANNPAWNAEIYARYTSVVDAMAGYSNLLGFFAGNEVVNQPNQTMGAPFVKAAVRDTKAYIKSKNYRTIGVGYATTDNQYIQEPLAYYMNCGSDQDNAVDFWGYNVYSWCGESTFQDSGYAARVQEFSSYSVPVFFAEYGCNTQGTRIFEETPVIYSSEMDNVWSGGIVYLYFQEVNNYGLVTIGSDDAVTTLADFPNLSKQIATVSPTIVTSNTYSPTNTPQACPTSQQYWDVATALPPSPDSTLCSCLFSSLTCVPSSNLQASGYGDIFNFICSADPANCAGIQANGTTGTYGPYGACTPNQQLAYVMDQYYQANGANSQACDFSGNAATKTPSVAGSCTSILAVASTSVAAVGGGGSGGASSSTGAAVAIGRFSGEGGFGIMMAWIVMGVVSGVGMLWL